MGIGMEHLLQLLLLVTLLTAKCLYQSGKFFDSHDCNSALAALSPQQSKELYNHDDVSNLSLEAYKEWDTIAKTPLTSDSIRFANGTELQLFPNFKGDFVHKQRHINNTRRLLGDFRQCSPCTCCDRSRRWCLPTVCCYNIRCGLRGLPFGLCSFTPVSCTCFGCRD